MNPIPDMTETVSLRIGEDSMIDPIHTEIVAILIMITVTAIVMIDAIVIMIVDTTMMTVIAAMAMAILVTNTMIALIIAMILIMRNVNAMVSIIRRIAIHADIPPVIIMEDGMTITIKKIRRNVGAFICVGS
nr:hypothetical protein [Evansella caseinilytica]